MPWLQAHLSLPVASLAHAEDCLEALGALAITLGDAADHPLLEPGPGEMPLWPRVEIDALFEADRDPSTLCLALMAEGVVTRATEVGFERIEDQAWERAWMDRFQPMRFGHRLWVCPNHLPNPDQADAAILRLDPGLAFGTGSHATTALCLEWLDGAPIAGLELLDYGCGSGILALAALTLGAASAVGVDHDPQALEASRSNADQNGLGERLCLCLPDALDRGRRYPLLLANILAGPLIELAPTLSALTADGGHLVLSGILAEQGDAVAEAYAPWFGGLEVAEREGWLRLSGRRRGQDSDARSD